MEYENIISTSEGVLQWHKHGGGGFLHGFVVNRTVLMLVVLILIVKVAFSRIWVVISDKNHMHLLINQSHVLSI